MKGHSAFLKAAARLARERHDVRFVCVGDGPAIYKQGLAKELGLESSPIWAGARNDMPSIYNALDLATSSSIFGEGLPNVIGEAMACGVPCVVTDVDDSAILVSDAKQIVPAADPSALAAAWALLSELPDTDRAVLAQTARERIVRHYSVERLVRETEAALTKLVGCHSQQTQRMRDNRFHAPTAVTLDARDGVSAQPHGTRG